MRFGLPVRGERGEFQISYRSCLILRVGEEVRVGEVSMEIWVGCVV